MQLALVAETGLYLHLSASVCHVRAFACLLAGGHFVRGALCVLSNAWHPRSDDVLICPLSLWVFTGDNADLHGDENTGVCGEKVDDSAAAVVNILLQAHPAAARCADADGCYPLHCELRPLSYQLTELSPFSAPTDCFAYLRDNNSGGAALAITEGR